AGSFQLPALRYPYYDVASGDAATATLAPRVLMVAAGLESRAPRALPPLARGRGPVWTDELAHDLVPWGWLVLFVGPPLLAWLWRRRRPAAALRVVVAAPAPLSRIGRAEREFHALLASHVPDAEARDGDGLGRALRAAGVESAVADHVMRLRDRLRAARYGPRAPGDAAQLASELEQVLRVLDGDPARTGRRGRARRAGAAPPPDAPSEPLLVVGLATPGEWALLAALLWVVLWIVAAGRRRRPVVFVSVAVLTAGMIGLATREALRRGQPVAIVVHAATSVRV